MQLQEYWQFLHGFLLIPYIFRSVYCIWWGIRFFPPHLPPPRPPCFAATQTRWNSEGMSPVFYHTDTIRCCRQNKRRTQGNNPSALLKTGSDMPRLFYRKATLMLFRHTRPEAPALHCWSIRQTGCRSRYI